VITDRETALVEDALLDALKSDVTPLTRAARRIVQAGGKRIRPRIVLLSYCAAGGQDMSKAIPLAAAVELLHTASLIHDDINDGSALRRGIPTVNGLLGNGMALLVGDFVFAQTLQILSSLDPWALGILAAATIKLVEGETLQSINEGNAELTEEDLLEIIARKTGALFSAAAQLGALAGAAGPEQTGQLGLYGLNLGIAFQIQDDTLDLVGQPEVLGKPVDQDAQQGKANLALLHSLRCSDQLRMAFESRDAARVRAEIGRVGGIEYALGTARDYAERAKDALCHLPPSPAKQALAQLADRAWQRPA
jgi:geranylgeranyl pyrophosphate synthase